MNKEKGFTLLELMVVLFVVVLGFSAIGINMSSGHGPTELKGAARDMATALRYARGHALTSHQETILSVDLEENTYAISNRDKIYTLPEGVEVTVVTAQKELTGQGGGNIRFFADGSSSGGRVTLERDGAEWQVDINWLTGQVTLEKK